MEIIDQFAETWPGNRGVDSHASMHTIQHLVEMFLDYGLKDKPYPSRLDMALALGTDGTPRILCINEGELADIGDIIPDNVPVYVGAAQIDVLPGKESIRAYWDWYTWRTLPLDLQKRLTTQVEDALMERFTIYRKASIYWQYDLLPRLLKSGRDNLGTVPINAYPDERFVYTGTRGRRGFLV